MNNQCSVLWMPVWRLAADDVDPRQRTPMLRLDICPVPNGVARSLRFWVVNPMSPSRLQGPAKRLRDIGQILT